jgi:hypothetical protein
MSTWRMEEVNEFGEAEKVEDEDSVAAGSRFARKVASFGMGVDAHYTPWRIYGEDVLIDGSV